MYSGVVIYSMSDIPLGFGVAAKSTSECRNLKNVLEDLQETTDAVIEQSGDDPNALGSAAVDYLEMFGYVAYAYMWVMMAEKAHKRDDDFGRAKLVTAKFYFSKILPQVAALKSRILAGSDSVMALEDAFFQLEPRAGQSKTCFMINSFRWLQPSETQYYA
eukprot:TRINITY_DN43753_c0_g1_i4.p1 TRINITY_DN43753_c0_g1~~TRINITY_DN43753_c0_g1_i4.p1  ORF type:complete len:161 (-),score=11.90 TRINITY_DN43753_c0_g1_i4:296-778(-)